MANYDDKEGLDDYGRKIRTFVTEELEKIGRSGAKWWMERQTAEIPHPRVHVEVAGVDRWFQIDQEEQALGTTDEQLRESIRGHLRFAFEHEP
jgi:hypothetical protein